MGLFRDVLSSMFGALAPWTRVQVENQLSTMAAQNPEKLDWRNSVVDLTKLLGLDSSLGGRKELARRLGYRGVLDGSAAMNIWLHDQIIANLAANNGVFRL